MAVENPMNATTLLRCAEVVERLVGSEPVAARWHDASALEGYTVGGLPGHLAQAVATVARYLEVDFHHRLASDRVDPASTVSVPVAQPTVAPCRTEANAAKQLAHSEKGR